jgi:tetratricopeptide (TPR) repeat protein
MPAIIAIITFIGGMASSLMASYIQVDPGKYQLCVWITFVIAIIVTIIISTRGARSANGLPQESPSSIKTSADRSGAALGPNASGNILITGPIIIDSPHPRLPLPSQPTQRREAETSQLRKLPLSNLPYPHNEYFTGREDILLALESGFKSGNHTQALSGIGGIGKTQTALEYAYRYREEYKVVLWGKAHTRDVLADDFVAMAKLLDLPEKNAEDQGEAVKAVRRWLAEHDGWLLIFDNADDLKMVREFTPVMSKGRILFTTRVQAANRIAECHRLEKLSAQDGAFFLLHRINKVSINVPLEAVSPRIRSEAESLSEELDGLPLALDQAAAYIEEMQSSLAEYLQLYRADGSRLRARRGDIDDDHPESVFKTFSLAFKKVSHDSPAAADLLRLCAFLQPDAIPEEIFSKGASKLGEVLGFASATPERLVDAIGKAGRFSLLQRDPETKTFSIHRLVQDVLKDEMDGKTRQMWAEQAIRAMAEAFPDVEYTNWPACERLIRHAQALAKLIDALPVELPEASQLLNRAGYYLYERAQYEEAELLYIRALAIYEKTFGLDHPATAENLNNLARLCRARGKYEQAEALYKRALDIYESALGPDHPNTAASLHNLARLYRTQGMYDKAESLYVRALAIREKVLGPDHPDTAANLNSMASLYYSQRKYDQAERLFKRALAICEKVWGTDHPDTATSLNNLAGLYYSQRKYDQAERLFKRALKIYEQTRGPLHPDTGATLDNLAALYYSQKTYDQAEPLYKRALVICEKVWGTDHPDTATRLNNLAELYYSQGTYDQAEPLQKRAFDIREHVLGALHPDTNTSLHNLVKLYYAQRQYDQAELLYVRALAFKEKALGPDHLDTAKSLNHLAGLYQAQGKYDQATLLYKRVLDIKEKTIGQDHHDTATSLHNLAFLYYSQGKYEEAELLFKRALNIYEKVLGKDHLNVAVVLGHYAALLRATNHNDEAAELEARAEGIRERATTT